MAVMVVLMVVLIVIGGHHMGASHDRAPSAAEPAHMQAVEPAKAEQDKK